MKNFRSTDLQTQFYLSAFSSSKNTIKNYLNKKNNKKQNTVSLTSQYYTNVNKLRSAETEEYKGRKLKSKKQNSKYPMAKDQNKVVVIGTNSNKG